jgi:hypothetical protein
MNVDSVCAVVNDPSSDTFSDRTNTLPSKEIYLFLSLPAFGKP